MHFISKYTTYTWSTPILSTGLCLSWLPRFCWQTNTRPSRPNQVLPSPALPCPEHLQSMPGPVTICHGLPSLALHSLTLPFPPLSGSADRAKSCQNFLSPRGGSKGVTWVMTLPWGLGHHRPSRGTIELPRDTTYLSGPPQAYQEHHPPSRGTSQRHHGPARAPPVH